MFAALATMAGVKTMSRPPVSVGLVTWNSASFLPACLGALAQQDYRDIELIVVDNASADDSLELVSRYASPAAVVRNDANTGFCHAHNQAIEASTGTYYLALNPDIEMQSGFIRNLVHALEEDPAAGSALGKLLLPTEGQGACLLDSTGLFLDRRRRQWARGHGEVDRGQYDNAEEVFGADGAAPLYRRRMLEDIKIQGQYFDEAFFAHKEDVDLAWRARMFGWSCRYEPAAVAFHRRSFRPGRRSVMSSDIKLHAVKNRYFLLLKNETRAGWRRDWAQILWYDLKILAYICLFERSSLAGLRLLWQHRSDLMSWRRSIQTHSRVSPRDLLAWFR